MESGGEFIQKRQEIFEEMFKFLSKLISFTFFNDFLANAQTIIIKNFEMFDKDTWQLIYERVKPAIAQFPDSDAKSIILSKFSEIL